MSTNHKSDTRSLIALKTACIHILLLCLLGGANSAIAEDRYALIIGNSNYQHVAALKNPVNDARTRFSGISTVCRNSLAVNPINPRVHGP
jgi:hypothetical protein